MKYFSLLIFLLILLNACDKDDVKEIDQEINDNENVQKQFELNFNNNALSSDYKTYAFLSDSIGNILCDTSILGDGIINFNFDYNKDEFDVNYVTYYESTYSEKTYVYFTTVIDNINTKWNFSGISSSNLDKEYNVHYINVPLGFDASETIFAMKINGSFSRGTSYSSANSTYDIEFDTYYSSSDALLVLNNLNLYHFEQDLTPDEIKTVDLSSMNSYIPYTISLPNINEYKLELSAYETEGNYRNGYYQIYSSNYNDPLVNKNIQIFNPDELFAEYKMYYAGYDQNGNFCQTTQIGEITDEIGYLDGDVNVNFINDNVEITCDFDATYWISRWYISDGNLRVYYDVIAPINEKNITLPNIPEELINDLNIDKTKFEFVNCEIIKLDNSIDYNNYIENRFVLQKIDDEISKTKKSIRWINPGKKSIEFKDRKLK